MEELQNKLNKEPNYQVVDLERLANLLAEDAWKEDTKKVHADDLYTVNSVVLPDGNIKVVREIRPFWAANFFGIKQGYLDLMYQFIKKEGANATGEEENNSKD